MSTPNMAKSYDQGPTENDFEKLVDAVVEQPLQPPSVPFDGHDYAQAGNVDNLTGQAQPQPIQNPGNQAGGYYVPMHFPEPWGPMGFIQQSGYSASPASSIVPQQTNAPYNAELAGNAPRDVPWQLAMMGSNGSGHGSVLTRMLPTQPQLRHPTHFIGDSYMRIPASLTTASRTGEPSLTSNDTNNFGRHPMSLCSSSQAASNSLINSVADRTRSAQKQRDATRMFMSAVSMSGGASSVSSLETSVGAGAARSRTRKRPATDALGVPAPPKVMAMSIQSQQADKIVFEEIAPRINDELEKKRMTRSQMNKMKDMMRKKPEMWKEGLKKRRPGAEAMPVMPLEPDAEGLFPCPRCIKRMKTCRLLRQHLAFHARANSLSPRKKEDEGAVTGDVTPK